MEFITRVLWVQCTLKKRLAFRHHMVQVINDMWHQYLSEWYYTAVVNKDDGMRKILLKIRAVESKVMQYAIDQYLQSCIRLHNLAYIKYRLKYHENIDPDKLRSIMNKLHPNLNITKAEILESMIQEKQD